MDGILYGVSVGPGDPDLLTLKAARILAACPVVAAPQTAGGKMLALEIASGAVDMAGKEILALPFLMTRDREALEASHRRAAAELAKRLGQGKDVAVLNLGDVSIYSSFCYLMEILTGEGFTARMVPGVTSFCAVAAALGTSLTAMDSPLHILPGDAGEALDLPGTKVLMKTGTALGRVKAEILGRGLGPQAMLVQNCGLPDQRICRDFSQAPDDAGYFTTIVVKG